MTPKRTRTRLAKSELWMHLAATADRWATYCDSPDLGPDDFPLAILSRTYELSSSDLARLLTRMADELETRAMRSGYDEHWDPTP